MRVGFFPSASNFAASEGGGGAATGVLLVGDDTAVDDGACGFWWSGLQVEVGFAYLFAFEGENWECGKLGIDGQGFRETEIDGFGWVRHEEL